jgi:internalin A
MCRQIGIPTREFGRVLRSGRHALLLAVIVLPWLAGCDKLPKATDYIGNKEEPKAAPAPAPVAPAPMKPAAPPPPPKKRAPEEVLGEFNKTKPKDRTDGQLAELAKMEDGIDQVKTLSLAASKVSDAGIKNLEKFDAVTDLNLSAVDFSNSSLESVAKMKSVEALTMENTPTLARQNSGDNSVRSLDAGLAHVKNMPRLRKLVLTSTRFSDTGLEEIAQITDLEELGLQGTFLRDEQLVKLTGLKNLRVLDISRTRVSDACFESLMAFKDLEVLRIGNNLTVNGSGFLAARRARGLQKLKHLNAAYSGWNDEGMKGVEMTPTLEYLDLGKTNVNDNNIRAVMKLKDLQYIYLHELERLSGNGLIALKGCKELKTIFLDKTGGINDKSLDNLKGLKNLERLVVTNTSCTEIGCRAFKKVRPECVITVKQGSTL